MPTTCLHKMDRLSVLSRHVIGSSAANSCPPPPHGSPPPGSSGSGSLPPRPRIAVLVSFWGAPSSHADWIVTKLIDGYWWESAHTPSRVDVVSMYMHQVDTSLLGQHVALTKGIPVFETVEGAVTLGGEELAVDGVVIVAEHGNYITDLKGHWLLPRWWIYQQVVAVFERSQRAVPVFNDKHLSYNWSDAKWMYDKSRELNFPLSGGSSIPFYFREPEVEVAIDTPIRHSIVMGGAHDEVSRHALPPSCPPARTDKSGRGHTDDTQGGIFHAIDVLQGFVERRQGGETGVKSVQSIRGAAEAWAWVESNPWAADLVDAVVAKFGFSSGHFQAQAQEEAAGTNVCAIEYNDGTWAAVIGAGDVGWTWAGAIEGASEPSVISMLGWAGPYALFAVPARRPAATLIHDYICGRRVAAIAAALSHLLPLFRSVAASTNTTHRTRSRTGSQR